jgi:hemolysin activation/secretion protein
MKTLRRSFIVVSILVFLPCLALAQEVGREQAGKSRIDKEKLLRERIEEEKLPPQIEEKLPPVSLPVSRDEKAFIKNINVTRVTLIDSREISGIIAPFENKELSLAEMQKVVDLITDAYRKKGYVTSRAYLPPQKIAGGALEIMAIEGITGDLEIKGNRFFRSELIKKSISLRKGEPFNYNLLRKSLSRLNEHPDRKIKAVLVPGKDPGSTDIVLEVTDKLPIHPGVSWDNYASRYVRKNRYSATLKHNNLFGFDDIFSLQYETSDANDSHVNSASYILPVTDKTRVGLSMSQSSLELGQEYKDLNARGKSREYNLFAVHELMNNDDLTLRLNTGFRYLDSFNFQSGFETSRDRLRVLKIGLDMDYSDSWLGGGRTIFSPETNLGLPDFMGGLEKKDPDHASREGAGGKYIKTTLDFLRLQKLPFSTSLLWKNRVQISPYVLTASEQEQLGGISNVRGYPSGEYVGDQGYTTTFELLLPPYGLPKEIKVPFSKATFHEAFKLALFYDWGWAQLHRPQPEERKEGTLSGAGIGFRLNLPENFSLRADLAWSLSKKPSDDDNFHPWLSISKEF